MTDKLVREFRRAIHSTIYNEGRPARLGNSAGVVYPTSQTGTVLGHMVFVRYDDAASELAEAAVHNSGLPTVYNLPVLVVERGGRPTAIIDQFSLRMQDFVNYGGWLPQQQHAFTHRWLGIDRLMVDGRTIEPGAIVPTDPAGMTVYVHPVFYRYNGVDKAWTGGATGSMAAYVPAMDNGVQHFVIPCLDRENNVPVILDGGDYGDTYGAILAMTDVVAVTIPEDYAPLGVVELYYGMTAVQSTDITFDRRRWLGDGGGAGGFALDVDKIMTDANGDIMADANGNLMVGE